MVKEGRCCLLRFFLLVLSLKVLTLLVCSVLRIHLCCLFVSSFSSSNNYSLSSLSYFWSLSTSASSFTNVLLLTFPPPLQPCFYCLMFFIVIIFNPINILMFLLSHLTLQNILFSHLLSSPLSIWPSHLLKTPQPCQVLREWTTLWLEGWWPLSSSSCSASSSSLADTSSDTKVNCSLPPTRSHTRIHEHSLKYTHIRNWYSHTGTNSSNSTLESFHNLFRKLSIYCWCFRRIFSVLILTKL